MGNDGTPLFYNPAPMGISIHVPAWGTTSFKTGFSQERIFQSTFPRGERRRGCTYAGTDSYFNPRSRVGNDVPVMQRHIGFQISIHVPAWGTTLRAVIISLTETISIHVPAWGTTKQSLNLLSFPAFQSTFPRGERRDGSELWLVRINISIHVPAWGTTAALRVANSTVIISIHVPAWGTTTMPFSLSML